VINLKEHHPFMKWSTVFTLIAGLYTTIIGIYLSIGSICNISAAFEPHYYDTIPAFVIGPTLTVFGIIMFRLATWSLKISDGFQKFSQLSDKEQLLAYTGMIPGMFTAFILIVVIIVLFDNRQN